MVLRTLGRCFPVGVLFVVLTACDVPFDNVLPPSREDIQAIRNDSDLTPQEKRAGLEALGLSPLIINGILIEERTGNQYGGDLRTAYNKITGGQFDELTPDEVQILADTATDLDDDVDAIDGLDELTDAQAQTIVTFFQSNDITSKEDLIVFLEDPLNVAMIPSDIPDGALDALFVEFDTDLLIDELP